MTTTATPTGQAPAAAPPLQMIRAEIDVRAFQRWAGKRRLMSRNVFDEDYAIHCLLTESFGRDLAPKPFRLIIPRDRRQPHGVLYGYGAVDAATLRERAGLYADPLQCQIMTLENLVSKPMPARWEPGKRLGFEVRIRPTVRQNRGTAHPGAERDAFQWEAQQYPEGEMPRNREEVYRDWLIKRLAERKGAELESATLRSFQRTRSVRKLHGRTVEGPDAVMQGTLSITDADAFNELLTQGVGRHRAYGYGMLLLRPPAP